MVNNNMELPMAGQQPVQEQPMQEQPEKPVQQKGPYPSTRGEAMQFSNDILQVLYSEKIYPNILKQLDEISSVDIGKGVGLVAGHLVGNRVQDVRGQTGRKIEMKLVVDGVQAVIGELAEIAERNQFFTMTPQQKKQALAIALKMLDEMGGPRGQRK